MKNKNIIEVKNLNYKNIFHDFNLNIEDKKITAITGPNNSGKSTIIKVIDTLISTKENVIYNNTPIEKINKTKLFSEIGIVSQEDNILFFNSTVEDELFSILENLKIEQKDKINQYQKIVKLLNLEDILLHSPNELNNFSRIRLLLASTLLTNPKVLLLDDICSLMTKSQTKQILSLLKELNKKEKTTIIITTNDLNDVIELNADYLYILDQGKIALEGNPLDVLKQDNKINRLGLSIPFMVDLSVKLNDYNLINNIILDMDGMVQELWK